MTTTRTHSPQSLFDAFAADDAWLGFGYIGARRNALDSTDPEVPARPDVVALVDAAILARANQLGWDRDDLFAWANSKLGRWFGDVTLVAHAHEVPAALEDAFGKFRLFLRP